MFTARYEKNTLRFVFKGLNSKVMNVYTSWATIGCSGMTLNLEICPVTYTAEKESLRDNSYISPPPWHRNSFCVTLKNAFLPGAVPSVYFSQLTFNTLRSAFRKIPLTYLHTRRTCNSIRASDLAVTKRRHGQYAVRLLGTVLSLRKCRVRQQLFVVVSWRS